MSILFSELTSLRYGKNMFDNLNDSSLSDCDMVFFSRWLPLIWEESAASSSIFMLEKKKVL